MRDSEVELALLSLRLCNCLGLHKGDLVVVCASSSVSVEGRHAGFGKHSWSRCAAALGARHATSPKSVGEAGHVVLLEITQIVENLMVHLKI